MVYKVIGNVIALRLEIGEEIVSCVKAVCDKEKVKSAVIHGIGAEKKEKIGLFDFDKGEYKENELNRFMELTSLDGSMTKMNAETYIHLHANFGSEDGSAFGGHLKEAVIGATAEIFIFTLGEEITRFHDDVTGLNLLEL